MNIFKLKNMGNVSLVLGMQATRDREKDTDHQPGRLHQVGAQDVRHERVQTSSTPGIGPKVSLEQSEGKLLDDVDKKRYKTITDSATSVTQVTRYDIMYEVCHLPACSGNVGSLSKFKWLRRSTLSSIWPVRRISA